MSRAAEKSPLFLDAADWFSESLKWWRDYRCVCSHRINNVSLQRLPKCSVIHVAIFLMKLMFGFCLFFYYAMHGLNVTFWNAKFKMFAHVCLAGAFALRMGWRLVLPLRVTIFKLKCSRVVTSIRFESLITLTSVILWVYWETIFVIMETFHELMTLRTLKWMLLASRCIMTFELA